MPVIRRSGAAFAALVLAGLCSLALARLPSFEEREAIRDSLRQLPPRWREFWLRDRGLEDPHIFGNLKPESTGLRLVGKFGRGPAVEVTGRDSLVFLSLGSEVAVVSFARPDSPRVLSEIQLGSIAVQAYVRDSLLFTGDYGAIDIWNVRDPAQPARLGRIPYGVGDFCVQDTFVYFMRQDTFRVFNVASPADPRQVGFYRDSATALAAAGNTVVCGHPRQGVVLVDVSNPAQPHRAGSYSGWTISATARGNTCYATFGNPNIPDELTLRVLDISNPTVPIPISRLDSCGGYDVYLQDTFAFLSGYYTLAHHFRVLSIADSTRPRVIGSCYVPGDKFGLWPNLAARRAYIASSFRGLALIDISSLVAPVFIRSELLGGQSEDVAVQGSLAFVASDGCGMVVLDVSSPGSPTQIGIVDSLVFLNVHSVAVRDSFAYMHLSPSLADFRVVDVTDPAHPASAGGLNVPAWPEDIVLRDSFAFVAEDGRLQVINVARPRQPVLVGSCGTGVYSGDLELTDTFAYLSGYSLKIIDVARPDNPRVVGDFPRGVTGLCIVDTVLYAVGAYAQFWALSITNPTAPRPLDSVTLPSYDGEDVAVVGTTAYASESRIRVIDISDPGNLRITGQVSLPYWTPRLAYAAPYLYACCADAGICIFETTLTAIRDAPSVVAGRSVMSIAPNPSGGLATVRFRGPQSQAGRWSVCDVLGREVTAGLLPVGQKDIHLSIRAAAGVYVLELRHPTGVERCKIVKK